MFYHLENLEREDVQDYLEKTIKKQAKKLKFKRPVIVAIDFHDIPYYGDRNDPYVVGTKRKVGTNYCHKYATIEVMEGGKKITLHAIPINVFSNKARVVKSLIDRARKYVEIKLVLLDRGFFSSYVISQLQRLRVDFLMPAVLNRKIMWIKRSVYGYEMKGVKFNLIVGGYKWATSLTKVSSKLSLLYKKRWNIETGYRDKKKFRITTTTRNHVVRMLFFYVSVIVYNFWIMSNVLPEFVRERIGIIKRITKRMFRMKFLGIP